MVSCPIEDFGRTLSTPTQGQGQRAPAGGTTGARSLFPSRWQRERARRIHRICGCIEGRRQRGQSVRRAARWFAWYWKDSSYKSDPGRPVRLSAQRLVQLYYQWRRNGRTPEALALRYSNSNRKVPACQVMEMARLCAAPGNRSFADAWRKVSGPSASHSAFWHAMPAAVRGRLVELCEGRRRVEYLERRAQKAIARLAATIVQEGQ